MKTRSTSPITVTAVAALMLFALAGTSKALWAQSHAPQLNKYAILYTRGPKWLSGKPVFQQHLRDHVAYETKLLAKGILLEGGPFDDSTGGLAIIQVHSLSEAKSIVANDPAYKEGVMIPHLHKWDVFFSQDSK